MSKGHFETPLMLRQRPSRSWWDVVPRYVVEHPLVYVDRKGMRYEVPRGFVTDGASVTRWLIWAIVVAGYALGVFTGTVWWMAGSVLLLVCTRTGPWMRSAVLHDWLGVSWHNDAVFRQAMLDGDHVFPPIAWLYWAGPALFGQVYSRVTNRRKEHEDSDLEKIG